MYKTGRKPSLDAPESCSCRATQLGKFNCKRAISISHRRAPQLGGLYNLLGCGTKSFAVFIKGMQRDKNNRQSAKNKGIRKA